MEDSSPPVNAQYDVSSSSCGSIEHGDQILKMKTLDTLLIRGSEATEWGGGGCSSHYVSRQP